MKTAVMGEKKEEIVESKHVKVRHRGCGGVSEREQRYVRALH
jgi:hypothetical protein